MEKTEKTFATIEENLGWFEDNRSTLASQYNRRWVVISNKTIIYSSDNYQDNKSFRKKYSKIDNNSIGIRCVDYDFFLPCKQELRKNTEGACSISAADDEHRL